MLRILINHGEVLGREILGAEFHSKEIQIVFEMNIAVDQCIYYPLNTSPDIFLDDNNPLGIGHGVQEHSNGNIGQGVQTSFGIGSGVSGSNGGIGHGVVENSGMRNKINEKNTGSRNHRGIGEGVMRNRQPHNSIGQGVSGAGHGGSIPPPGITSFVPQPMFLHLFAIILTSVAGYISMNQLESSIKPSWLLLSFLLFFSNYTCI
uniref:Uncharacterized protein n=1 Tax=Heterorhabditis bacteriophora TaxID=37862 RepID=A0A1I7X7M5_HETBA